jgi:DNA-binding transcriptional ArsR family regulator
MHLNKSANSPAYRIGGSIGFTAAARSVWITAKSKEDPSRRLFLPLKNNLAADADGLTYFIVPDDAEGIPIVRWAEPAEEDLNEALRQETGYRKKRTSPERDQIVDILKESGEPLSAKDIAEQLGKNRSTVRNLLAKMRNDGAVHCPVYGVYAPGDIDTVDTVDSRQE